jgi:hypothetical protein
MNKNTEESLEKIRLIKKNLAWNDALQGEAVEKLKRWSRIGDSLIDKYDVLNLNDCVYIMELLQVKIDFLNLMNEYFVLKEKLKI